MTERESILKLIVIYIVYIKRSAGRRICRNFGNIACRACAPEEKKKSKQSWPQCFGRASCQSVGVCVDITAAARDVQTAENGLAL